MSASIPMQEPGPVTDTITIGGYPVTMNTLFQSSGFATTISVPAECTVAFRATLSERVQSWVKVQNVEHAQANLRYCWQEGGHELLLESATWQPSEQDLAALRRFMSGSIAVGAGATGIVTEDLEAEIPPLRRHDLPSSLQDQTPDGPVHAR